MPPSKEGTLFFAIGGGAEWGGNATDPSGILYQNANEMVWDINMTDVNSFNKELMSQGNKLYLTNCAGCHGVDRKGASQEYPNLVNISDRLDSKHIHSIIQNGRGRMPSFQNIVEKDKGALISFLLNKESKPSSASSKVDSSLAANKKEIFPYDPPFILKNGLTRFFDSSGYPAIKPPWGTLNAIDLNTGEYLWKVPLVRAPK